MSGKLVSRILKKDSVKEKYLITCGASAGLSIAFGAPLAGVLFSIEEVHKQITKKNRYLLFQCCCSSKYSWSVYFLDLLLFSNFLKYPMLK